MNDDLSNFDSLPPKLRERIIAEYGRVPPIDPAVEQLILSQARADLLKRKRLKIFAFSGALGAAAAVVIALLPNLHTPAPSPQNPPALRESTSPPFAQNDLNHDRQLDIIDVYLLAKSQAPQEQINALAYSVVSVKVGPASSLAISHPNSIASITERSNPQ